MAERTYGALRGVGRTQAPRNLRPRLTPHQREVYGRIVRQSRHNGHALAENIGSTGAVEHLVEKGYVVKHLAYTGPRGREFYHLIPVEPAA